MKRSLVLRFLLLLLFVAACSDEGGMTAPDTPDPPEAVRQVSDLTPFQAAIQRTVETRSRDGLPVPEVSFDYTSSTGQPLSELREYRRDLGETVTLTATTTVRYDHPEEAGFDRWPATVLEGELPEGEGFIRPGDYDDEIRAYVDDRNPGFWDRYEFGLEPRTRVITETITITSGEDGPRDVARATVDDDLVHGFTITGPGIDWTVGDESCLGDICAWQFEAGFRFDFAYGMRLPMNVSLTADGTVDEGTTFTPTSLARGVNWSADQYSAAGIAPENGNEFVMRHEFFLGATVKVGPVTVLGIGPDEEVNRSKSFTTPFGPGALFALPDIDIPLHREGVDAAYVEFGAYVTPYAGSDRFLADWSASGGLSGSGSLIFTDPQVPQSLASVFASDGPAQGNLRIDNSKYVFTQFKADLGAYFKIDIFGLFTDRYPIPIESFDLSNFFSISVPIHAGANPTTLNAPITVRNVPPTVGAITGLPTDPVAISDQPLSVGAPFTDPAGALDQPYTCAVDYDDGTGHSAGTVAGMGCGGPDHTYAEAGVYNVTVLVDDKDQGQGTRSADIPIVVYDPDAGFVTGGGWIDSPAGAYTPDDAIVGKATFGFVAKYKRGASVPDGNTEFQFRAAGLNFHSTQYDWLVVNQGGSNAQFKGIGNVNGVGPYRFMLWARDGEEDTFRIKIWSEEGISGEETVLYDNGVDQVLGGGSIVIHTR